MAKRIVVADFASTVPWVGVQGVPDLVKALVNKSLVMSDIGQSGATDGQVPTWSTTQGKWVPKTVSGASTGTTIANGAEPGIAVRRRPPGYPSNSYENIWANYVHNVRLYGATGSGLSDTIAVGNAITAINAKGYGMLYFPGGIYNCSGGLPPITVDACIAGDGAGVSTIQFGGGSGFEFYAGTAICDFGVTGVTIENCTKPLYASGGTLWVDKAALFYSGTAIDASAISEGFINRVSAYSQSAGAIGINLSASNKVRMSELSLDGSTATMLNGIRFVNTDKCIVSDSLVSTTTGAAITLDASSDNNRIHDIALTGVAGTAIVSDLGSNNYVNGLFGYGTNSDTRYNSRRELVGVKVWDPPAIPVGSYTFTDVLVPGAQLGDQVLVGAPYSLSTAYPSGWVVAAGTARIMVMSVGTSTLDLPSGTWKARVIN